MELCSDKHEEICFDGRICPLCEKIQEVETLERRIENLENDITELNETQ